jgi:hypothetical protein
MAQQEHILTSEEDATSFATSQTTNYPVRLVRKDNRSEPQECVDEFDLIGKASLLLDEEPTIPLLVCNIR